ncbi:MAG: AraC family ligand binding domain-containing protein, partial [Oscillospiraceae bacterium]
MGYEMLTPLRPITVEGLVTVHYFEYSSSYYFEGESHDFWELLYVDKGELDVDAGEERHHLTRGQMIFHQPGEFHALHANGVVAPNLVVLSFLCQ